MGESSSSDASLSFSASSSSEEEDNRRTRRHRHHHRSGKRRNRKRSRTSSNNNNNGNEASISLPPAPSDWDQLRSHFQFVLPDDDDDNDNHNNRTEESKYGSTWQQRMVRQYHAHLYKEYVLADLSRVSDIGKVGLRWRTEGEVASGRGFRSCGNLMCEKEKKTNNSGDRRDGHNDDDDDDGMADNANALNATATGDDEAVYSAAARKHMGIGVAENGGKVPLGVVLPTTANDNAALDSYLQSCAGERRKMTMRGRSERCRSGGGDRDEEDGDHHRSRSSSQRARKSKRKRHRRRRREYDKYSIEERERSERKRLSRLPHGAGLHDYEVDFVYVEHRTRKRELVKVRLCLRCAPLLFVSKMNDDADDAAVVNGGGDGEENEERRRERRIIMAPAMKAREAREDAARSHRASMASRAC